ncbi:hypothetical protein K7W03_02300 [Sphingobium sp. PNB]|uniref:hypothetical protein n=1 Tax=Sphingobium sp. PNB TaxID=863934 RepID=UPI001CA3B608|nr:hypothetical protein [Sphingobium sp. PNB]MCB4858421.1 hypothetical protein [Sphingobium sp. PNB]
MGFPSTLYAACPVGTAFLASGIFTLEPLDLEQLPQERQHGGIEHIKGPRVLPLGKSDIIVPLAGGFSVTLVKVRRISMAQ